MKQLRLFLKASSGATAIEYAMVAGLLSIAIIAGVTAVGTALAARLQSVGDAVGSAG